MTVKYYSIADWRKKHPNDLKASIGCENINLSYFTNNIKFITVINSKGVSEVVVKRKNDL